MSKSSSDQMSIVIQNNDFSFGNIYISSESSLNLLKIQEKKISAVIAITRNIETLFQSDELNYTLVLPLKSDETGKLIDYLETSLKFLEKYQSRTNILVYCSDGKTLCPIILMAFLIKFFNYDFLKAYSAFSLNREVPSRETVFPILKSLFPNILLEPKEKPKVLNERTNLVDAFRKFDEKKIKTDDRKTTMSFNKVHSIESYQKNIEPELRFEDINCIVQPNENNVGGIFLGNISAASSIPTLKKLRIGAVLTVAEELLLDYTNQNYEVNHLKILASDVEHFDLSQHFPQCFDFIVSNQTKTNVLIHCYAGVSRSVTITIAYLMKFYGLGFKKALAMVREKRKQIYPNSGFVSQLKFFETVLAWERNKENLVV